MSDGRTPWWRRMPSRHALVVPLAGVAVVAAVLVTGITVMASATGGNDRPASDITTTTATSQPSTVVAATTTSHSGGKARKPRSTAPTLGTTLPGQVVPTTIGAGPAPTTLPPVATTTTTRRTTPPPTRTTTPTTTPPPTHSTTPPPPTSTPPPTPACLIKNPLPPGNCILPSPP